MEEVKKVQTEKEAEKVSLVHNVVSKFPLYISEKLEKKIRVLCNKFPNTEWSGILFYTFKGSFQEGITFTAEDLLFMDLGYGATTEFYLDEANIASYICDHDLFDSTLNCGLIHSHHSMKAFFSSQDDSMLLQEGKTRNHFLSLVVNNDGNYVAKVTCFEDSVSKIVRTSLLKTFNNTELKFIYPEETLHEKRVVTYDLSIQNENKNLCDDYEELMDTIDTCLLKKKEREEKERKQRQEEFSHKTFGASTKGSDFDLDLGFPYSKVKEPELPFFDFGTAPTKGKTPSEVPESTNLLSEKDIKHFLSQIICLDFKAPKNMEIVIESMDKIMAERFPDFNDWHDAMTSVADLVLESEMFEYLHKKYPDYPFDILEEGKLEILQYLDAMDSNKYIESIKDYINF